MYCSRLIYPVVDLPHFWDGNPYFDLRFCKNSYQSVHITNQIFHFTSLSYYGFQKRFFHGFIDVYVFGMPFCITPAKNKE